MRRGRGAAAAVLVLSAAIGTAFAQSAPNPTQQRQTVTPDQVPVFRVSVVGRTTQAINFRPRSGETKIDFVGTTLLPQARGDATIKGERGVIAIDANFERLKSATQFGPEYLTYVLWAITPEGRASNLGELQVDGDDGELKVTTELQAFGLLVTAEPYFAVTQPSDVVVLESVFRKEGTFKDATIGRVETIEAKYELLKRGSYLMNQDPARLKARTIEPGVTLDLAEARNAVALARVAGADRYAADTFAKASGLLAEAELARERRRGGNAVMQPARQAVQTAEDARLIAVQRQEEEYAAQQRALAQQREADALARARAEEAARRQAEQSAEALRRQAETDRLAAESARLAAERDAEAARLAAAREAEAARLAAARDKAAADAERLAIERQRAEADAARAAAEAARQAAEAQAQQARDAAAQADKERAELRERLRQQLNVILETRETARGLIVNLSDVLFDTASANLKPGAREKLSRVAGIVLSHPGLKMEVEGHADSRGTDDYNQRLSERRAASVRAYLVDAGIAPTAVGTAGFGESKPVATNATAAGRQQNRRVELVVSGEPIGREQ